MGMSDEDIERARARLAQQDALNAEIQRRRRRWQAEYQRERWLEENGFDFQATHESVMRLPSGAFFWLADGDPDLCFGRSFDNKRSAVQALLDWCALDAGTYFHDLQEALASLDDGWMLCVRIDKDWWPLCGPTDAARSVFEDAS